MICFMKSLLVKEQVLAIIKERGKAKESLLAILLDIQSASGENCVSEEWARLVSKELGIPLTMVFDILSYYAMFSTKPRGRYVIEICNSTPCYVTKSDEIVHIFEKELGVKLGETTPDKLFTLMHTACVGACDIGPVAKIGDKVYGNLTEKVIFDIIKSYRESGEVTA